MSNAMELGRQIQAMAGEVIRGINDAKGKGLGSLAAAVEEFLLAQHRAEHPIGPLGLALGDGHPGLEQLTEQAAQVIEAVETVRQHIDAAIAAAEEITDRANAYGFVFDSVGASLMRGGGQ